MNRKTVAKVAAILASISVSTPDFVRSDNSRPSGAISVRKTTSDVLEAARRKAAEKRLQYTRESNPGAASHRDSSTDLLRTYFENNARMRMESDRQQSATEERLAKLRIENKFCDVPSEYKKPLIESRPNFPWVLAAVLVFRFLARIYRGVADFTTPQQP